MDWSWNLWSQAFWQEISTGKKKKKIKSAALFHSMNGMNTSTLWLILHYPSCEGPNTAIHDQAVDEMQATEDTQQEAIDLCNHKRGSCICNQERKAPGPCGIPVEALKLFTDRMCDTQSVTFNKDVWIKLLPPRMGL